MEPTTINGQRTLATGQIQDKLRSWLQLLRVPNLFTVPGDPLAGFCLACVAVPDQCPQPAIKIILVPILSLIFYAAGLILNDFFDLEEDRHERPARPLPSGRINPRTAFGLGIILCLFGVVTAFWGGLLLGCLSLLLVLSIAGYNAYMKQKPFSGPLNMGLCRGISFLLGASLLGWKGLFNLPVFSSFAFLSLFIAGITYISARETAAYKDGGLKWLPLIILIGWLLGLALAGIVHIFPFKAMALLLAFFILGSAYYYGRLLKDRVLPEVIQKTIGLFIRILIPIQAALISLKGGSFVILALIILLAWPVSRRLAGRFYAS